MNERIRQLAEQARQEFLKLPTGYKPEQVGMHPQLMEKFAELIVQECIDIISPYTIRMGRPGEEYLHPIQEIKTHFGVE